MQVHRQTSAKMTLVRQKIHLEVIKVRTVMMEVGNTLHFKIRLISFNRSSQYSGSILM